MKRYGVKRLFRFPSRTRADVHDDIREDFEFHLDMRTEELVRSGLTRPDARARAVVEFGDRSRGAGVSAMHQDRIERRRRLRSVAADLQQDLKLGLRLIVRSPGFSAAVVLTLAIAIGANTAVFSVANALLLKPVPVAAPQEVARVRGGSSHISWLNYQDLRERSNDVFADLAAHRLLVAALATTAAPVRLRGEATSTNSFVLLGVSAALGRTFTPQDSRADVVVIANHLWRGRFGSDPSIVGRALTINGRPFEVIGVMPRRFRALAPPGLLHDFWVPVDPAASRTLGDRLDRQFEVFGRLKTGVSHTSAQTALQRVARQLRAEHPAVPEFFAEMEVFPLDGLGAFRGMASLLIPVLAFLSLLAIVSGFVILIGCANIAGLLMGRAVMRRREIAVRVALGAGRGRLVRQLLAESLILALAGGAAGAVLAFWLVDGVNPLLSGLPIPAEIDLRPDPRVLVYAGVLSTITAMVFGLAPARRAAAFDVVTSLKDETGDSTARGRLRRGLVVGQVAVCTMLLVWSGLFLRSLNRASAVDPGFDAAGVLLAGIELDAQTWDEQRGRQLFVDLQDRLRVLPGVVSAGMASVVPLSFAIEEFGVGFERADGSSDRRRIAANRVTPGWFDTVRIPIVRGRDFTPADRVGAPSVVIVNETLARQFWNGDAIGRRLFLPGAGQASQSAEVVGVVRDSKYRTLGETTAPTVYQSFRQAYFRSMTLHVRTKDPRTTTAAIAREMALLAPDVFVQIEPMSEAVAVALVPAKVGASATGAFGVVAMLLSALGVYGLVSFSVVQRTREMGVRKAIGARTSDILTLVVGANTALAAVGLLGGLGLGALGALALQGFMTGVSPMDPLTLAVVAALVMGAALVASALPALRAARVDPLVALRDT